MSNGEDQRAALNIKVGLASTLITVSLALIGAAGGIAVFVLDKRDHLTWFYTIASLAILLLVASVISGGIGVHRIYRSGYTGQWSLLDRGEFSYQSLFCLAGAVLVFISSVIGNPRSERPPLKPDQAATEEIRSLRQVIEMMQHEQDVQAAGIQSLNQRLQKKAIHKNVSRGRADPAKRSATTGG